MTQPEKERTVDDAKVEQATNLVFEVCIAVSVLRCDERPLDEGDREEVLDILAAVIGDASDSTFTFVGDVDVKKASEPVVEEIQAAIHTTLSERAGFDSAVQLDEDDDVFVGTEEPEVPVALGSKACAACHSFTTQLDVNQCPMCGNPFS